MNSCLEKPAGISGQRQCRGIPDILSRKPDIAQFAVAHARRLLQDPTRCGHTGRPEQDGGERGPEDIQDADPVARRCKHDSLPRCLRFEAARLYGTVTERYTFHELYRRIEQHR